MDDSMFLAGFGLFLFSFLGWGIKHLPGERWQMLAVIPTRKGEQNSWLGTNFTYYGFFIATSQLIAFLLLIILLGAAGISLPGTILTVFLIMCGALPAARLVAILVEKKRHTFTIGGASFVGIVLAPWAIQATGRLLDCYECSLPMIPILAALSIAYTLGEGLGRLACLSFGCCYGKPLKQCSKPLRWLFARTSMTFHGSMKKAAYEGKLSGERLVPIQAITSIIYTSGALAGAYLFLSAMFTAALLATIMLTQLWRILSETMRADFRGFSKISTYQKMGLLALVYMFGVVLVAPAPPVLTPDILAGLAALWHPAPILGLQLCWLLFFFWFGRSTITGATVFFTLAQDRI